MNGTQDNSWQAYQGREIDGPGWTAYGESIAGHQRSVNEDNYLLMPLPSSHLLAAVADGLGGHTGGDLASSIACDTLFKNISEGVLDCADDEEGALLRMVHNVHGAIRERATRQPDLLGMGTTLTLALVSPGEVRFGHIGDSRLYRVRAGVCQQLTRDHTPYAPENGGKGGSGHLLEQALGVEESSMDIEVSTGQVSLQPGDSLVLCSDGLSDRMSDSTLAELVSGQTSVLKRAHDLVQAALHVGSRDDITALLIDILEN